MMLHVSSGTEMGWRVTCISLVAVSLFTYCITQSLFTFSDIAWVGVYLFINACDAVAKNDACFLLAAAL